MSKLKFGKIHLIIGPMYAGKTTELVRLMKRATIANRKCLVIKFDKDVRYDETKLVTHDLIAVNATVSLGNNLRQTLNNVENLTSYNCIFVDEIQFYEDGAETCDQLANEGFEVIVSGLQGDFQRKKFGCIPDLIPIADRITHLTAIDKETGEEAPFTYRLTSETEQEVIGGNDKYIAVDRLQLHFIRISSKRRC